MSMSQFCFGRSSEMFSCNECYSGGDGIRKIHINLDICKMRCTWV